MNLKPLLRKLRERARTVQRTGAERWENLCDPTQGCGVACCYHEGEPCEQLDLETKRCRVYANRFGRRRTVTGKEFLCSPMMVWLRHKHPPAMCGYAKVTAIDGKRLPRFRESVDVPMVRGQS